MSTTCSCCTSTKPLLTSPLVYEQLPGMPEPFPHIYGPINIDAVVDTQPLP